MEFFWNNYQLVEIIGTYGTEALRYILARHVHPFEDTDLTHEMIHEVYTANLVNGLGNLVARVMKLAETHLDASVECSKVNSFTNEYMKAFEAFEFNKALDYIWKRIGDVDQRMTDEAPFKLVKTDPEAAKKIIAELTTELYCVGQLLSPIMPETSEIIKEAVLTNKKPENLFVRIEQ